MSGLTVLAYGTYVLCILLHVAWRINRDLGFRDAHTYDLFHRDWRSHWWGFPVINLSSDKI